MFLRERLARCGVDDGGRGDDDNDDDGDDDGGVERFTTQRLRPVSEAEHFASAAVLGGRVMCSFVRSAIATVLASATWPFVGFGSSGLDVLPEESVAGGRGLGLLARETDVTAAAARFAFSVEALLKLNFWRGATAARIS